MILTVPFAVLPLRMAVWTGGKLGFVLYQLLRRWRHLGYENFEKMLPWLRLQPGWNPSNVNPAGLTAELFENMGKLVAEISRLYHGIDKDLIDTVEFRGMEHFDRASARGRGVMFITAHCGNWELMALSFGARHKPVAVVAKPMKKQYIDKLLEKMRYRYGNSVIYRDQAVRGILTILKANGIVGILPDQVAPPPHGVIARFMGRPAWTTMMPVKVAMKSKAALLPIFIHREGNRNIVTIHPEMELSVEGSEDDKILRDTDRLNRYIEEHIVLYPTQWNWFYRRWKGTDKHE
jgi:KDO2-lipid IV(A) lauroyltransferase